MQGIFRKYISVILLGVVIKLLDDEIDDDRMDKGLQNKLYQDLIAYKFPYCLLFLSLSMLIEPELIFSLFTSSYMIGMFHFPRQKLPTNLKSYHEIIILLIINLIKISLDIFAVAFLSILLIQLIDDLQDYTYDFKYGYKNYAVLYGKGEIIILSSILIIFCILISWLDSMIILSSSFLIKSLYAKI